MANNLDLEEQEQLAELKHFWNEWGNLITWVLIAVFGAIAAYNGWNYWQRTQAVQAAALFDEGYKAVARLRLAALLVDAKQYDEALKQLAEGYPPEFEALAADRRGDVYSLQGKKPEAKNEYLKAWKGLGDEDDYRRLVEVK